MTQVPIPLLLACTFKMASNPMKGHDHIINHTQFRQGTGGHEKRAIAAKCSTRCLAQILLSAAATAAGEPAPIATFNQHTDYVNCLAAAKARPLVASAGLRAEVFLWDMQTAMRINEQVALLSASCPLYLYHLLILEHATCRPVFGGC